MAAGHLTLQRGHFMLQSGLASPDFGLLPRVIAELLEDLNKQPQILCPSLLSTVGILSQCWWDMESLERTKQGGCDLEFYEKVVIDTHLD